jgi:hypothetical protein
VNYQSATGLRCFMFSLGAVFAESYGVAMAFAAEHGLLDHDAHAQLSLDEQAARRRLIMERDRPAALCRTIPGRLLAARGASRTRPGCNHIRQKS